MNTASFASIDQLAVLLLLFLLVVRLLALLLDRSFFLVNIPNVHSAHAFDDFKLKFRFIISLLFVTIGFMGFWGFGVLGFWG